MSRKKKRIRRIKQNPKNVTFEDLNAILLDYGWIRRTPRNGSSHYSYTKEGDNAIITVPYKRPFVKEYYVKSVIERLNLEDD